MLNNKINHRFVLRKKWQRGGLPQIGLTADDSCKVRCEIMRILGGLSPSRDNNNINFQQQNLSENLFWKKMQNYSCQGGIMRMLGGRQHEVFGRYSCQKSFETNLETGQEKDDNENLRWAETCPLEKLMLSSTRWENKTSTVFTIITLLITYTL